MMAFILALVIAAVLATGVGLAFNSLNESSAQAYSTSAARLDQYERVKTTAASRSRCRACRKAEARAAAPVLGD